MTKDGLAEKIGNDLKRVYDGAAKEPVPADMKELLDKLK